MRLGPQLLIRALSPAWRLLAARGPVRQLRPLGSSPDDRDVGGSERHHDRRIRRSSTTAPVGDDDASDDHDDRADHDDGPSRRRRPVPAPVIDPNCPLTSHAAVIDRDRQRAWLCDNGVALPEFVITTALDQPDPGTYPVFGKSMNTSSRFGGHYSTMTHFVAFTRGEKTGARVAFHTVPVLRNGEYVQPLGSVGTQMMYGDIIGLHPGAARAGPGDLGLAAEGRRGQRHQLTHVTVRSRRRHLAGTSGPRCTPGGTGTTGTRCRAS